MQEVPWVYNQPLGHTMTYRFGPFSFAASEGLTRDCVEVRPRDDLQLEGGRAGIEWRAELTRLMRRPA